MTSRQPRRSRKEPLHLYLQPREPQAPSAPETVPADAVAAKQVSAARDHINGYVRLVARDPMKPSLMRVYWLTDEEAAELAAELAALAPAGAR